MTRRGWFVAAAVVSMVAIAAAFLWLWQASRATTGAYGASPCESAWTDDEHLNCQRFTLLRRIGRTDPKLG